MRKIGVLMLSLGYRKTNARMKLRDTQEEKREKKRKEMATTTWALINDPTRECDPKSDGKSEPPSPATSSSIGVW